MGKNIIAADATTTEARTRSDCDAAHLNLRPYLLFLGAGQRGHCGSLVGSHTEEFLCDTESCCVTFQRARSENKIYMTTVYPRHRMILEVNPSSKPEKT